MSAAANNNERTPGHPLTRLSDKLSQIVDELGAYVIRETATSRHIQLISRKEASDEAKTARAMLRERRLRAEMFDAELFGEPAWDILLDLFAAHEEYKEVSVSSLCIAAAVPSSTALRWIKALTDKGLLLRTADPDDGRKVYVALSVEAVAAMRSFIQKVSPTLS